VLYTLVSCRIQILSADVLIFCHRPLVNQSVLVLLRVHFVGVFSQALALTALWLDVAEVQSSSAFPLASLPTFPDKLAFWMLKRLFLFFN